MSSDSVFKAAELVARHSTWPESKGQPQESLCSSYCTHSEAISTHSSSLNCSVIFSSQFFDAVFYMF
jgi:hypothetical protein